MNWYKKAQLFPRNHKGLTYLDIGHESEKDQQPNIMWVYWDGRILTSEETFFTPTHAISFPEVKNWGDTYAGRYEPETGRVSIQKPVKGSRAVSFTPSFIIRELYKKFPNITTIHEF